MNKRDLLEVSVKVMGLYCLFSLLGSIIALGVGLSSADSKFVQNKTLYASSLCLATLLYLVFAIAFVRGGKCIAEMMTRDSDGDHAEERGALPPHAHLYFWVRILGLYFFVSIVGHLVSDLAQAGMSMRSIFWWSRLLGEILQIGFSLAFIFKSQAIAKFVEGVAEPITGAKAG
jgi:O-antigen/teichoic acid export membrane protein